MKFKSYEVLQYRKLTNCQVKLFKTGFTSGNPRMISFIILKLYHCISSSMHEVIYINQAIEKEKKFMFSENSYFATGYEEDFKIKFRLQGWMLWQDTNYAMKTRTFASKKWLCEEMAGTCWQSFQFFSARNYNSPASSPKKLSTKCHREFCLRKSSRELAWKIAL